MISIVETKDSKIIAELNATVQNLHARLHPELFKPFDKALVEPAIANFLADPHCKCYLARTEDTAIGYVLCFVKVLPENAFQYSNKTLYIDQIVVIEKYQRTGAGNKLMLQVESLAASKNIKRIELDHWSLNTVAAAYFKKAGYSICKERLFKQI